MTLRSRSSLMGMQTKFFATSDFTKGVTTMNLMTLIFIAIVVLGWRLRRDNAKRNEILERIASRTSRPKKLKLVKKPKKLVVKHIAR